MPLDNPNFNELIEDHELSALLSEPTYFKSINPTCIANFLTSKKTHFMKTLPFETGVSDHHKLKPKKLFYRCYKNFGNEKFEEELKRYLFSVLDFELLHLEFKTNLDQLTPLQQNLRETTINL